MLSFSPLPPLLVQVISTLHHAAYVGRPFCRFSHPHLTHFSDGLAVSGGAPKIFSRTTRSGLPHVAVGVCSCFALLAYMTNKPGSAFAWFSGFSSTAGLTTWFGIGVTYLRFYKGLKTQGIDRKMLPFASRMQPYAGWWCVLGTAFILFVRVLRSRVKRPRSLTLTACRLSCTVITNLFSSALGMFSSSTTGLPPRS